MTGILSIENIPKGTYFLNTHVWVRKNIYGLILIGIELPKHNNLTITKVVDTGTIVKTNDFIFSATTETGSIQFSSPINGIIKFVNPDIVSRKIVEWYENDWVALILAYNYLKDRKLLLSNVAIKKLNTQNDFRS